LESLKSIPKIEGHAMTIRNGNHVISGSFIYGMITNARSVGGIKGICGQEISLNDGLFEVTLVREPMNPMDMQNIATGLFSKNEDNPMVERFKTDSLIIESEKSIPWSLDGEYGDAHTEVMLEVVPTAVKLLVPENTTN
jgi:diacylglycerol kinase family enzyme